MTHWQPSASLDILRIRANFLKKIRDFFSSRSLLEVETPLIAHTSVTDPYIASIPVIINQSQNLTYYLQTSPEYGMKRLLASGIGDSYQITKAFRQGEIGPLHNPEFTLLEWYRLGFDHHQLMDEVDDLLQCILHTKKAERKSYADLFQTFLQLDPHHASIETLKQCAKANHVETNEQTLEQDDWLHLLLTHCIEPHLGLDRPCFIFDFPPSQAALARIQKSKTPVASRFEVYVQGIELANGFHELTHADEQLKRFKDNLMKRKQLNLPLLPIDQHFLDALTHGLPDSAGVALGIDRLIMIATGKKSIKEVMSFDFSRV